MTEATSAPADPDDLRTIYSAGSNQWVHAEQMRWTILYNFLVGNTIVLLAWSTLFAALVQKPSSLGVRIVIIGLCLVGFIGSVVWALLEHRANRFAERYFLAGLELERRLLGGLDAVPGPFTTNDQHRTQGGAIKTHVIVIAVPVAFAVIYVGLLVVGVYAAAGVI